MYSVRFVSKLFLGFIVLFTAVLPAQTPQDSLAQSAEYLHPLDDFSYAYGYCFGRDLNQKTAFSQDVLSLKGLLKGIKAGLRPDSIQLSFTNTYLDKIMQDSGRAPLSSDSPTAYHLGYSAVANMLLNYQLPSSDFKYSCIKKGLCDYYKLSSARLTAPQMDSLLNFYFLKQQQVIQQQLKAAFDALAAYNLQQGTQFLEQNALKKGIVRTSSGLQYQVIKEGKGPVPGPNNRILVHYTGTLLDDRVFDSSIERGEPAEFVLKNVIKGWQEGLQRMKEGGRYRLFVPAALGYGVNSPPSIPPNSVLLFDIELLTVKEAIALDSATVQMSYSYGFVVGKSLQKLAFSTSELNPNMFVQGFVKGFDASDSDMQTVERLLKTRVELGKAAQSDAAAQKIAFSIGLSSSAGIARQMGVKAADFDFNTLGNGYADALRNIPALFSDTQMNQYLQSFFEPKQNLIQQNVDQQNQILFQKNQKEANDFLEKNAAKEGVVVLENGLQYIILQDTIGPKPTLSSTVTTHYSGRLIDGREFDSSIKRGEASTFSLAEVIEGWQIGILLMSVGSKYRFFIPAAFAYKSQGSGTMIEPGSTLIFDIELLKIN